MQELSIFIDFIRNEYKQELEPNLCEITYVNPIVMGDNLEGFSNLNNLLTVYKNEYSDDFLQEKRPENVTFITRYLIKINDTVKGRLYISLEPKIHKERGYPIYLMKLIARGQPLSNDVDGIMGFMDLGREWIVRGFTSITTSEMHDFWKRVKHHD
jgi:hypothetical protein